MPDPVADVLRNVQTSDRLRAAAWDAAYSSDDPNEVAERLRALPIGNTAKAKLWDARFADAGVSEVRAATAPEAPRRQDLPPGQFLNQMIRNAPSDAWEQATNLVGGTGQLLGTMARATAEIGSGIGNTIRETVGLQPMPSAGTENLRALGSVPGGVVSHYAQYADPVFREQRVREHPVGTALDLIPVGAGLSRLPAAGRMARRGASAAATRTPEAVTRAIDTAIGVVTKRPIAAVSGAMGGGPVETARQVLAARPAAAQVATEVAPVVEAAAPVAAPASAPATPRTVSARVVSAPEAPAPVEAPARPARRPPDASYQPKSWTNEEVSEILRLKESGLSHDAAIDAVIGRRGATSVVPASPAASTPAVPVHQAVSASPESAPALSAGSPPSQPGQSVPRSMSVQRIRNEVGIQARRQQAMLSEAEYTDAENLVRAGRTPEQAVQEVALRRPATKPAESAPEQPAEPITTEPPRGVLPDELQEYVRLRQSGKTHKQTVKALEQARSLGSQLGTPTPESVRQRVAVRNATGRWPQEEPVTPAEAPAASVETPKPAPAPKAEPAAEPTPRRSIYAGKDPVWGGTYRSRDGRTVVPLGLDETGHLIAEGMTRDGRKSKFIIGDHAWNADGYKRVAGPRKPKPESPAPQPAPAAEAPPVSPAPATPKAVETPAPAKSDPLVLPDSSPEYVSALQRTRAESAKFTDVQRRYRAGEIGDPEYLAARKAYDKSVADFDRAYMDEQGRAAKPKAPAANTPAKPGEFEAGDAVVLSDGRTGTVRHVEANSVQVGLVNGNRISVDPATVRVLQKANPAPVKPAETTVAPEAKKPTKTPAAAAAQVKSQVEKVIDLKGAKSAGDVQKRVVAALEAEIEPARQAQKFGDVEVHPSKAYGGREFTVFANGEPVAHVDRYGNIQAAYGASDELVTALGGKPVELGKYGDKSKLPGIDRASDMTPSELHKHAKARFSRALSRASGAGTITVQIPGDGTFTIERNAHAIEEVIRRLKTEGSRPWRGLIADEKPLPKPRSEGVPNAAYADRPWTKWE